MEQPIYEMYEQMAEYTTETCNPKAALKKIQCDKQLLELQVRLIFVSSVDSTRRRRVLNTSYYDRESNTRLQTRTRSHTDTKSA